MRIFAWWCRVVGLVVAISYGAVSSSALAFDEPDGFRGVPWGASEEQTRAALNSRPCEDYPFEARKAGDRYCLAPMLFGEINVEAMYTFRADRLARVALHFESRDDDRLSAMFVELYGPPTGIGIDRLGWSGASTEILLVRNHSGTMKDTAVIMTTAEARRIREAF
jgi:hypothetical protein